MCPLVTSLFHSHPDLNMNQREEEDYNKRVRILIGVYTRKQLKLSTKPSLNTICMLTVLITGKKGKDEKDKEATHHLIISMRLHTSHSWDLDPLLSCSCDVFYSFRLWLLFHLHCTSDWVTYF